MDNVKQQTILALDLGTITGFAIKDQSGVIISGVASFHNKRFEGGGMVFLRFKQWLTDIQQLNSIEKKDFIETEFIKWKSNLEQVDDVMVIGVTL